MAIQWGNWDYGYPVAYHGFRVGMDISNSIVNSESTNVVFTVQVYVESMYAVNDDINVVYLEELSGSKAGNLNTVGPVLWDTLTWTYTYGAGEYGGIGQTKWFRAGMYLTFNGAQPYKITQITIPPRPAPAVVAPKNLTATRVSDTRVNLSWQWNTTGGPYTSVTVQRRKWSGTPGSSSWTPWVSIGTTGSNSSSYVDLAVGPNAIYEYQIRSNSSFGSSSWIPASTPIYMSPAAPTNVVAALQTSGTSIVMTWMNNHYDEAALTYEIWRSAAGGAYVQVASGLAQGTTTWTDNSLGAGSTKQYRVLVAAVGARPPSGLALSNVVLASVAPNAPTLLFPNGSPTVDASIDDAFWWTHNPGGDLAPQSHFELRYSSNGGSTWTTLYSNTPWSAGVAQILANTFTNGTTYLWQVRTEGVVSAGYGPWSASATLVCSKTPVVAVTSPPTTVLTLPMTATWTYTQQQSSAQAAWELTLTDGYGTVVEAQSGTGATLSRALDYRPTAGTYVLSVRSQSAAGRWSPWATRTLTLSLSPPAHVTTTGAFQPTTGTTVLGLTAVAPGGGEVAVVGATIERRVPGGDWVTLATDITLPNTFVDPLPATKGVTEYRTTAISASPTYRAETIVSVDAGNPYTTGSPADRQWVFVNYGDAFTSLLRFRSAPKIQVTVGRDKEARSFLGRPKPVPALGEARFRSLSVGGTLVHDARGLGESVRQWDSPPTDWEDAGQESEVVCYRDFTGRRIFGLLGDVSTDDISPGMASIGFGVTEVDYTEVYG